MKEKSQIIDTVKNVMPVVVSIIVSKKLDDLQKELPQSYPSWDHPQLHIPPDKIDAHGMVQIGGGSGFITSKDGIILTNKHVIAEPKTEYTIVTNDGQKYKTEVIARDPLDDVAILKIINPSKHALKLTAASLDNSNNLEVGQTVLAFGNALGIFKNTVSTGIISGLSRSISAQPDPSSPAREMRGLIQTDAAINPGNSGGPLTDIFGTIIGINTAVVYGAQNIGFAIPIKAAERDLKELKKYGEIRRPFLGLRYLTLNQDIKEKLNLPVEYGALVVKEHPLDQAVIPKGSAAKAGLKEKDIILKWGGQKITTEKNIQDYLENCTVGSSVMLKVLRGKKTFNTKIVLGEKK